MIVQTRSLKDTVVSLKDMFEKSFSQWSSLKAPWIVGLDDQWKFMCDAEKYLAITAAYAFWHLDFKKSWARYPKRVEVSYEDVTKDTLGTVSEICSFFRIEKSAEEIQQAIASVNASSGESTRLNIGRSGRGAELLSAEVQAYIENIESIGSVSEV